MGLFDKLLNSIGGRTAPTCPTCGKPLDNEELVQGSYWCDACGALYTTLGSELVDVKELRDSYGDESCEICQASLSGAVSYLPYEDGRNSHAYIKCASCGHENIRYGFGED